jgi:fido (protein-threonine AMPylation protein)
MTSSIVQIWPPETGIEGLPANWRDFRASEVESIQKIWGEQRDRLQGTAQLADFTERLSREWSIETGIIENVYSINSGVTKTLIEHGFREELITHGSTDKPKEYIINILRDQKNALDGVFDFVKNNRQLSTSYIKELHSALMASQDTTEAVVGNRFVDVPLLKGDWKIQPNYPLRDGVIYQYCAPEHVSSEMDRLVAWYKEYNNAGISPEVLSAWLHHRFTQIHPFQDGNGRVARTLASLVLIQAGLFPLVITRNEKTLYLQALEEADKGDLQPSIALIARFQRAQFRKATAISEDILAAGADVNHALAGLIKAANEVHEKKRRALEAVFGMADTLLDITEERLTSIRPAIRNALQRASGRETTFVLRSKPETSHYFRNQIINNARSHYEYFADMADYRSWTSLNMNWERQAKLVIPIHGIGRPFTGSLICSPFLEFRDTDEDAVNTIVRPVADEAFVFFYNEKMEDVRKRFSPWLERAIMIAIAELSKNI